MGLFRILWTLIGGPSEAKCDQIPVFWRAATMASSGAEEEGFRNAGQFCSCTTNLHQCRRALTYIEIKPEAGLSENKRILGNGDEASLANQGTRN